MLRYRVVLVTPEMASDWLLKSNTNNRRMVKSSVDKIISALLSGEFVENGETIKFSATGRLLDGQHRLAAIVKTGISVRMTIAEGLDENVFRTIDTGRCRNAPDILSIRGASNVKNLSGVLKVIHCHLLGFPGLGLRLSNTRVDELYEKFPGASEYATLCYKFHNIGSAVILGSYWFIASLSHGDLLDEFFNSVGSGASLGETSPALALRNAMIAAKRKNNGAGGEKFRNQLAAYTIKAINAELSSKPLSMLRHKAGEKWPRIIGDRLFGSDRARGQR